MARGRLPSVATRYRGARRWDSLAAMGLGEVGGPGAIRSGRPRRAIATATIAALLAALVVAAVAFAARLATPAERAEIVRLVHHDESGDITHPGRVKVGKIIVSTKGPWASAQVAMSIPGESGEDTAGAIFKRRAGHYKLVGVGTDEVGCGVVSNAIAEELGLGGCH